MTLDELTAAVQNEISAGTEGVTNFSYSYEQLEDEVTLMYSGLLESYSKQPFFVPENYMQGIDCIKLDKKCLTNCCKVGGKRPVWHFEIPQLVNINHNKKVINYLGIADKLNEANFSKEFSWYFDTKDMISHGYRILANKNPFVWIDPAVNGHSMHDVYLFNAPGYGLKFVSIRAIFRNPKAILAYDCCDKNNGFQIDDKIAQKILQVLPQQKIAYYARLNSQPNTQSSLGQ